MTAGSKATSLRESIRPRIHGLASSFGAGLRAALTGGGRSNTIFFPQRGFFLGSSQESSPCEPPDPSEQQVATLSDLSKRKSELDDQLRCVEDTLLTRNRYSVR